MAASRSGSPASRGRARRRSRISSARRSRSAAPIVEYLDGDTVRTHLSKGLGFSKEDRDTNIERIGWVAARLTRHGAAVIAAAISPYEETRQKARDLVEEWGTFVEVHVATSVEECARRDVKGLYEKAFKGEIKGFTGVDDPYEEPESPDVRIETEQHEPEESAQLIVAHLEERGLIPARGDGMSVATETQLIAPHGGELVDRTGERPDGVDSLETLTLTSARAVRPRHARLRRAVAARQASWARTTTRPCWRAMRLANGLPWALPVCLAVDDGAEGRPRRARRRDGTPLAVLEVEDVYEYDKEREAEQALPARPTTAHPGVARLYEQKPLYLAGRVTVFERAQPSFPELAKDPAETRAEFAERGWKRVVGFQTRNPIHRAHEYLTKVALETVDGLLDPPARRRDEVGRRARPRRASSATACCSTATTRRTASSSSAFPAAMRYAGPREAIWHAICRKNYGCSHFIVGRDHAGVGDYYGTYDAQLIFDEFEPHELDIEPMFFEHSFWCKRVRVDGVGEDVPARRRRPRLPLRHEGQGDARQRRAAAGRVLAARGGRGADQGVPRRNA